MSTTKSTVSQQVVDYLKENIANGAWAIGDAIPSENVLTKELKVSRASVRQAIQRFIAVGVLESIHGKGTFVLNDELGFFTNLSGSVSQEESQDIATIMEFRRMVEPGACFLAVARADSGLIERLRGCLDAMIESIGNSREFIKHDMAFHLEICLASRNPLVERFLREVFSMVQRSHEQMSTVYGYKHAIYYHTVLLRAFEMRDAVQARDIMAEQFQSSIDQISEPG